jgi:hypothetical protein
MQVLNLLKLDSILKPSKDTNQLQMFLKARVKTSHFTRRKSLSMKLPFSIISRFAARRSLTVNLRLSGQAK